MTEIGELKERLSLPPLNQIGVVVREMEKAVRHFSSVLGVGPFTVYEFVPDRHWVMEKPSYLKLLMGKAIWGDIELELVQPVEGQSDHRNFLDTHGEGLHHLGFNVPNYDEVFERFLREGFKPLMRAESYVAAYNGHLKACYFDTRQIGGILIEIIWKSWSMKS